MAAVSIVVPTYNERDNVGLLIERIDAALTSAGYRYEIVIVDDDSPDNTWQVAGNYVAEYPVTVIRRCDETSLATAVLRGFDEASEDTLAVMDCDLQHPPEQLPALLDAFSADEETDLVIGSRIADGGSFGDAGRIQVTQTYVANALSWLLFPETRAVRDVQSGFFVIHRQIIDRVPLAPRGYKILLELLVMGEYGSVREVGYAFDERRNGESNLDMAVIAEYLVHLASLWRRTHWPTVSIPDPGRRKPTTTGAAHADE